eukprot:TRINITY_DN5492_c0_g1_i1.p3 TRINITY_DN5492_c0_g1~~TRINITY_DN5492_c0_g1_i1.p3  ORF type:complete len:174 (+),score=76.80 TRINITY_DN5492_c0_g1_i1:54-524(+)
MKVFVCLAALVAVSFAHMCQFAPQQRGSMVNTNQVAADDCALVQPGPCGGRSASQPAIVVVGGSNFTVVFQKNLDHWTAASPGNFTVTFYATPDASDTGKVLGSTPDTQSPSLTIYAAHVTIPNVPTKHGIIQTVYYTNNPQAPPTFYQCADIAIV